MTSNLGRSGVGIYCEKRGLQRIARGVSAFGLVLLMRVLWAAALGQQSVGAQTGVVFTSLYSFTGGNDGYGPNGLVQGSNGYFYGTTLNGGANSAGTVFKISPSGTLTSLYSFTGGNDGGGPLAGLVQGRDGYFYGTTQSGGMAIDGPPGGTVFNISANGALANLYSFTFSSSMGQFNDVGDAPEAGLVQGRDGDFYGTAFDGGSAGHGTVFKYINRATDRVTSLYAFTGTPDGANPAAGLVQGSGGSFYGTTASGGTGKSGTVFVINPNAPLPTSPLTNIYSFTGGNDGGGPLAGLVQGSDGNFYGTTAFGGVGNLGTVFRINTNGALTTLYSFNGGNDGANPYAGLVQGSDGYFYGTTQSGGTNGGEGTIFKISSTGDYSSLYSFSGNDGSNPQSGLVQGSDGSFYGTTVSGGESGAGTVFRMTVPLGLPQLGIISAGTNVILRWTNTASAYSLQSNTNLGSLGGWTTVPIAPIVTNGLNTVTNPVSDSRQFFRLSL
jgi:uncharacterized repeat protein (TIGR03803 family)